MRVTRFHIPYMIWGTIQVTDSYKVPTFKSYCKYRRPHYKVPIFHILYGGTIRVIDIYKVPTFNITYGGTVSH